MTRSSLIITSRRAGSAVDQYKGWADEGFGPVADAFARNFADFPELGSAVTVFAGGRKVAELWGGVADGRTGRAWEQDSL